MATNKIRGITIEIGGDPSPLDKALESNTKTSKKFGDELKDINQLLKFDPSNVEAIKIKQDVLTDSITATKERLDSLKISQKQVEEQFKRGDIGRSEYIAFLQELDKTENKLKTLTNEHKTFEKALKSSTDTSVKLGIELDEVNQLLKFDPSNIQATKVKQDILNESIVDTKESLGALKKEQEQVEEQFKRGNIGRTEYIKFQQELTKTEGKLKSLTNEHKIVEKALKLSTNTSIKLGQELSDVNQLLKFDPSNIQATKLKQDILKESITATKEQLGALKEAQKQVEEQFKRGDIGRSEYVAFLNELDKTENKLKSLKEEQKNVSVIKTAFLGVKETIKETTDKLQPFISGLGKAAEVSGKIAVGGVKTVGAVVDTAATGLKIYTATALGAGTAAFGLAASAGAAADDINTLAAQTGLSVEQIQKFQYASKLIDVDIETLTGSMAKLTRNMATAQGGTGATAEAFSALGISITDSNGELRNNQDVFNEAIQALGMIENATQRDALAMQIFGKSAQDLNPLILGGADALEKLGKQAEDAGMILSEDALGSLNEFNDSIDILKSNATSSGRVIAGSFAGSFKGLTTTVGSALPEISASIAGVFSGKDTSQKLSSSLSTMAKMIISGLAENLPTFLTGFNSIILAVVQSIIETLPIAVETIIPTLIGGFTALISSLIPMIPVLLPLIIDAGIQIFLGLLESVNQIIPPLIEMLPGLIDKICSSLIENLPAIIQAGFELLIGLIKGITECIPTLINKVVELIPVLVETLTSPDGLTKLIEAGLQLIVALAQGLPQAIPAIIKAIPQIIMAIIDALLSQDWIGIGIDILKGIAGGLIEGVKAIGSVISDVANSVVSGFKNFFGIKSPSRLFKDVVGKNLALGIGEGFSDEMDKIADDMVQSVPTEFDIDPNFNSKNFTSKGGAGGLSPVNISLHIDKFVNNSDKDIRQLTEQIMYAADEYTRRRKGAFA